MEHEAYATERYWDDARDLQCTYGEHMHGVRCTRNRRHGLGSSEQSYLAGDLCKALEILTVHCLGPYLSYDGISQEDMSLHA